MRDYEFAHGRFFDLFRQRWKKDLWPRATQKFISALGEGVVSPRPARRIGRTSSMTNAGLEDVATGISGEDAFSSLLPPPELTARLLRQFARNRVRGSRASESETGPEWVGPGVAWQGARGELSDTDEVGEMTDCGTLASLPATAGILTSECSLAWVRWWLEELTRRTRRLPGRSMAVERIDDKDSQIQPRVAQATSLLKTYWPAAAVESHLLVRKVLAIRGLDSRSASDLRVFGAVAISSEGCHSAFDVAGELTASAARLLLDLRARETPPIINGSRLRIFPGSNLKELYEGLAIAVAAARRIALAQRAAPGGIADPAYLESARAELEGTIDILGHSADWSDWGLRLFRALTTVPSDTQTDFNAP